MRIAFVNWTRRKAGGAETYLGLTVAALAEAGHDVAFWHEIDLPLNREPISLPQGVVAWNVAELGTVRALKALRDWRPDLIYSHGLLDPLLEAETIRIAPAIFSAHAYYGTCVSGHKSFRRPTVEPCDRRFGWRCLVSYYPRRCGGLSPFTMLRLYDLQSKRLDMLHDYKAVLTHSLHMRNEYVKHGLSAERVFNLSYYVPQEASRPARPATNASPPHDGVVAPRGLDESRARAAPARQWPAHEDFFQLMFAGRMDRLKGGRTLLDALPKASASLRRPLHVTFAGDGPDRRALERRAVRLERRHGNVRVKFTGWLRPAALNSLLSDCDLLVFPSLWPEPFGLAGPEAGTHGVPVAAFAVGGIPSWLIDGVNGFLAPGDPPTAEGLAEAIVKCLSDPETYARLSSGAREMAQRFSIQNHLGTLLKIFEDVASNAGAGGGTR